MKQEELDNNESEVCKHEDLITEYIGQPYGTCLYCGQTVIK